MKLTLCFLMCLGTTALASIDEEWLWPRDRSVVGQVIEEQQEFSYGRELKYIYNGQVMTGIPGTSKQHGGSRIQAKVKFVCKHQETCILKIEQIRVGKLNRRVKTPRHVLPMNGFDEIHLDHKQREKLHLPVKFSNSKGLITNIIFDGREKPWSANIKRGILTLIQVDLQKKKHSTDTDIVDVIEEELLNNYKPTEKDAAFYRTLEETIEGHCETLYTVTKPQLFKSIHKEIFNVTKTINFEKCVKRPQVKYNFHFQDNCPDCEQKYAEDQKFLKSSSVASYQVIKTPKYNIIKHAHTESQYVFTPLNEEANTIVTYVSQNLKLIKTGLAMHRVQVPMNPRKSDSDMIYTLDYDTAKETFHMDGNSHEFDKITLHKGQQNKVQHAKTLLRKLVNNIREQVQEPATKHFKQLVNLLRVLSKPEIDQLHNILHGQSSWSGPTEFTHQERKRAKDLFHDAVGAAATKPCVKHLVQSIKRHELPIVKAVSSIKNLMVMHTPSKEIIEELIKLAESPVSERHYMLKQATWLTIGTLMKSLCANHEDQWAREYKEPIHKMCPKTLKQQYVKILVKKIHSTHKWDEQLIYVKALGNAGIDLSIFEMEKIIKNKNFNHRTLIRVETILALRKLKNVMPKKIQKVLMPVVSNKMEPQTLRISAAYMILQTLPERPVLDQLAKLVHDERSIQVASFIHSYMESVANSTNPCEKKLATNLKLSLRHTHRVYSRVLGNSKFHRIPLHSKYEKIGLDLDLATTFAEQRPVPRELAASLHSNFLGFWNKYLVSFRLATEGLDKIIRRAYNKFGYGLDEYDQFNSFFRSDYEDMFSNMDVFGQQIHDPMSKEPKAVLNLKIKNQDVAFLPLKRSALKSLFLHGARPTSGKMLYWEEKLMRGITINYNKATLLDEITYKIPTTIGMPVFVNIKVPAVFNVHGAVKMTPSIRGDLRSFQVKAVLKPSVVASVAINVECWSPIVTSGVKVVSKVKAFKPIDAKLLVDLKSETKIVKLLFKPPTQKKDLIVLDSKPYTFTLVQPKQHMAYQNKQKRLILSEEGVRTKTVHKCNTCNWLGVRFCVKGRYHKTPEQKLTNAPYVPFSGPNRVVISAEPVMSTPRTIAINLYGKFFKPLSSWNTVETGLSSARRNFLNLVGAYENVYETSPMDSLLSHTPVVDGMMQEAALYNKAPTHHSPLQIREHKHKRPLLNSLRVHIEGPQRRTTFDLVHIFNLDGDYQKVQAKIHRSPVPENPLPWKMCLHAESVFPTLKLIQDLPNGEVLGRLSLKWGHSCNSGKHVHVTKRLEKGMNPRTFDLQNPEWNMYKDAEMRHDELLKKSPIKYIFDIKYRSIPLKTKHYANRVLQQIKKHYHDHTDVAEVAVHNRPNHIKVVVALDPITLKKADILIKTPKSNVLVRDVKLPSYARPITHKHDYMKNEKKSLARETLFSPHTAQCYASEYNVKTFHDKELPLPLSHSYKVLAKDCETNQFTVLFRQLTDLPHLKEVKVLTQNHKITLKPSLTRKDITKVFINGRDQTLDNDIVKTVAGVPVLRVIRQSSHVKVEILTAGVSVYFDRKSVNVEIPPQKRHKQCGICGRRSFSDLKTELPNYMLQSPIINEIELLERQQGNYFGGVENVFEQQQEENMLAAETLNNPFVGGLGLGLETPLLRDYSTMEDAFGYYFNVKPTWGLFGQNNLWNEEDQYFDQETYLNNPFEAQQYLNNPYQTEQYLNEYETNQYLNPLETEQYLNNPFESSVLGQYPTYINEQQETPLFTKKHSGKHGWSRPSEREWEIEQLVSKKNPEPTFETLRDLQKINSEFDQFYTPVDVLERDIETKLAVQEGIFGGESSLYNNPWSPINPAFNTLALENELVDQEYFQNPYLNQNYIVNQQSCQYLPFYERKMQGCTDVFSTIYDMEREYDNVAGLGVVGIGSNYLSPMGIDEEYMQERQIENELVYGAGLNGLNEEILGTQFEVNPYLDTVGGLQNEIFNTEGVFNMEQQILAQQPFLGLEGDMLTNEHDWLNKEWETKSELGQYGTTPRKHKIVETEHSICFSIVPVECREKTYPKHGVKQTVQYHCMSRKNPQAEKYQNEILSGHRPVIPNLQMKTPTMTRVEIVPSQCQPVY